ncbi:DnaJ central domain-containing protein [Methylorubrum populi]|uniref:DnaJ central domain-containing protein n=1 Tax=Methylorubrum populi TaxID=223967 RepID=A0A160PFH6_9HYPH|nr:HNH endonuclease signature motif containing protein [Methylorubrum populi]BAU91416.1 DnaJ central domain-containing protein [Methylorubrum populi]
MASNTKPEGKGKLSEVEAAIRLRMSPELLEHFTRYGAKAGIRRKLACETADGLRWYEEAELAAFDKFLREPWPVKEGKTRPHMPEKVRLEIKLEANCGCAICNHGANCEAAHIEPVSQTLSHHPAGLIWLCPNHHTDFDKGLYMPRDVDLATVRAVKQMLVNRRVRGWTIERNASLAVLQLVRQIEEIGGLLANAQFAAAHGAAVALAEQDIVALEETASRAATAKPTAGPVGRSYGKFAAKVASSAKGARTLPGARIPTFAAAVVEARDEFLRDASMTACPLCGGAGSWDGSDCPACGGEGYIGTAEARRIDVSAYQAVDCPVCDGLGQRNGSPCTACGGERRMQRRHAEAVDARDYQEVPCPVCAGVGRRQGEECPACGGERSMERHVADRIDPTAYDEVDCPLCHGSGRRDGLDCPVCQGDGRVEARHAERVDLSDYAEVPCRLCGGSGQVNGYDCPPCGGDGRMERQRADRYDWSQYDLVTCPSCKGTGQRHDFDCRSCGGEGQVYRRQLAWIED